MPLRRYCSYYDSLSLASVTECFSAPEKLLPDTVSCPAAVNVEHSIWSIASDDQLSFLAAFKRSVAIQGVQSWRYL